MAKKIIRILIIAHLFPFCCISLPFCFGARTDFKHIFYAYVFIMAFQLIGFGIYALVEWAFKNESNNNKPSL